MQSIEKSCRFYRRLLWLCPSTFRAMYGEEMVRVFEDVLTKEHAHTTSLGLGVFWLRTILDVGKTALLERSRIMREQKPNWTMILGSIAILPSIIFFSMMILKFQLGVDNFLYNTWNDHWGNPNNRPFVANIADFFVIMGPAFAFLLAVIPLVRINIQRDNDILVSTIRLKINPTSIALLSVSVLIGCSFLLYFFAENFAWVSS